MRIRSIRLTDFRNYAEAEITPCEGVTVFISERNVDALADEHGCAVVYTHFGYGFVRNGEVRPDVKAAIEYVAGKDGWFAPASEILDFMAENKKGNEYISGMKSIKLDAVWIAERICRRITSKV